MKLIKISSVLAGLFLGGLALASCSDANEYKDYNSDNPSFVPNYTDSTSVEHPDSLAGYTYERAAGIKTNAFGKDIEGYVEKIVFESDSAIVTMSVDSATINQIPNTYTWYDDSNTDETPKYEYTYSATTGNIEILKKVTDDKGNVSKSTAFTGVALTGTYKNEPIEVLVVSHYGDVPSQTYLIRQ